MKSVLEALADNRLLTFSNEFEQTQEYQELIAQLNSCFEKCLNRVGENKQPLFKQLCSLIDEQNRLIAKDAFLYAFRLGALSTIEVFMHKDKLIISDSEQSPISETEPHRKWQITRKMILAFLSDGQINPTNPGRFDNELYKIEASMVHIQETDRFIDGYSLGVLMITEVFQDRDKAIAKQNYYNYRLMQTVKKDILIF